MVLVRKSKFSYVINDESITVFQNENNIGQYISFNCYQLHSRANFYKFKREIQSSTPDKYDTINDIYGLAMKYELRATGGHKPIIVEDKIAF
jgi:hypothetical protein